MRITVLLPVPILPVKPMTILESGDLIVEVIVCHRLESWLTVKKDAG